MASEDIKTAITVVDAVWAVGSVVFSFGGLAMWVRLNIRKLHEADKAHSREIEALDDKIQHIRENWVTKDQLEKILDRHGENVVNKILIAVGSERRQTPR